MNVVFLSPHFPPHLYLFCARLRELGATVLGIADAPWESLRPELRDALTEYYRVPDLHDEDALVRALGYFTHRHGKLDRHRLAQRVLAGDRGPPPRPSSTSPACGRRTWPGSSASRR